MEFPRLETERMSLRNIRYTDVPDIVKFAGDKEITDMLRTLPYPYEEKDAIFWINKSNQGFQSGDHYMFAISLKPDDQFMGGIGLHINKADNHAEAGYWIAKPYWGNGYASEALAALIHFGFETLKLHKIYAGHLLDNPASGKVMIKNNMTKEGELVDHINKNGVYKTIAQYRITVNEYRANQNT